MQSQIGHNFLKMMRSLGLQPIYWEEFGESKPGGGIASLVTVLLVVRRKSAFAVSIILREFPEDSSALNLQLHALVQYRDQWITVEPMACDLPGAKGGREYSSWFNNDTRTNSPIRSYCHFLTGYSSPVSTKLEYAQRWLEHINREAKDLAERFDPDTIPYVAPDHSDLDQQVCADKWLNAKAVRMQVFWLRAQAIIQSLALERRKELPFYLP